MNRNKKNSKKNSKKSKANETKEAQKTSSNANGKQVNSEANKQILDDMSIKKVTVTMQASDGSTIKTTEIKTPNGNLEREINGSDNKATKHEQFNRDKNDYLETFVDRFDDTEIKTVIRTTRNPDGSITKKTTKVTTFPDGRFKTDHTEKTFYPEQQAEQIGEQVSDSESKIAETLNGSEKESSTKEDDDISTLSNSSIKNQTIDFENADEDEDKVTTEKFNYGEIKRIESLVENDDGSTTKKTEVITIYNDGSLNRKTITENLEKKKDPYSDLENILSSLTDYLMVIKSDENFDNKNCIQVPFQNSNSGISYSSDKYEIINSKQKEIYYEIRPDYNIASYIHDYGSELMSKHVNLLTYYGNIDTKVLKNSLIAYFKQNRDRIKASEIDLDCALKSIDYNSDGELNYVEFVDFFCLFFSSKSSLYKNLMSVLNEHNINHSETGYLNRQEAVEFYNFLIKFYNIKRDDSFQFSDRISYENFVRKLLPIIENKLYVI